MSHTLEKLCSQLVKAYSNGKPERTVISEFGLLELDNARLDYAVLRNDMKYLTLYPKVDIYMNEVLR